ncbi:hypothetical protein WJX74_004011 [Apatococcus lobatus]|uniref:NOT2/NOT3/NOT5 C-terminal domain-containing protein n=1 Tax=Apatococcus lobatus TaxID=904363 RepID=A0AAW1RBJ5_9CHLO
MLAFFVFFLGLLVSISGGSLALPSRIIQNQSTWQASTACRLSNLYVVAPLGSSVQVRPRYPMLNTNQQGVDPSIARSFGAQYGTGQNTGAGNAFQLGGGMQGFNAVQGGYGLPGGLPGGRGGMGGIGSQQQPGVHGRYPGANLANNIPQLGQYGQGPARALGPHPMALNGLANNGTVPRGGLGGAPGLAGQPGPNARAGAGSMGIPQGLQRQVAGGGPHLGNQANLNHLGNPNHRAIPGMGAMGHVPGGLVGGGLGGLAAGSPGRGGLHGGLAGGGYHNPSGDLLSMMSKANGGINLGTGPSGLGATQQSPSSHALQQPQQSPQQPQQQQQQHQQQHAALLGQQQQQQQSQPPPPQPQEQGDRDRDRDRDRDHLSFDASEFPALGGGGSGQRGPQPGLANGDGPAVPGGDLYNSLMSKNQLSSEFSIQNEEFPALPGATQEMSLARNSFAFPTAVGQYSANMQPRPGGPAANPTPGQPSKQLLQQQPQQQQQQQQQQPQQRHSGSLQDHHLPADLQRTLGMANLADVNPSLLQNVANQLPQGQHRGLDQQELTRALIRQQQQQQQQQHGVKGVQGNGASPQAQTVTSPGGSNRGATAVSPDRFGLLGLLSVIRMTDPDLTTLALGTDLTTLGLHLNSLENVYRTFASPWADAPLRPEPDFKVPACYMHNPPRLRPGYFGKFQQDTLFYIFYSMPGDEAQLYAADELALRKWGFHKELKTWIMRAPGTQPLEKSQNHERGAFFLFDTGSWECIRKNDFVLYYDMLERAPSLPRAGPQPAHQSQGSVG